MAGLAALGAGTASTLAQSSDEPLDPYSGKAAPPSQSAGEPPPSSRESGDDVDDQVAQALYRRGLVLFEKGDHVGAKTLFVESLERSPSGTASAEAVRMLRASNQKLGIANLDDGRPGTGDDRSGDAGRAGLEGPMDPYGSQTGRGPTDRPEGESEIGRRAVIGWSAATGFVAGMALVGPESTDESTGETKVGGGAILAGLAAAGLGGGLSWWLTKKHPVTAGQAAAIVSATNWGAVDIGFFGDAVSGTDTATNTQWKFVAAGAALGLGAGTLYAVKASPSEGDVAFTNSLAIWGAGAGLLAGVGIQPPHTEAYSINALVGSAAGLATGLLLSSRVEMSRRRTLFLDLGAAGGAAVPWVLLYPLMADDTTENDEQVAGWLSAFTLGGGVVAAWFMTRDMDPDSSDLAASADPPPPALTQRDADGSWHLGAPGLRPLDLERRAYGLDLLSGRF